jgi:hypothetical protein
MIPESYHAHLSEKLTRSNYLLTILLIQVVQSIKEVTLERIATKLAMPIKFESRRKKVQRFLSDDEWDLDDIWLSLVIGWIKGSVNQNNIIYLAIDRTKWQANNILIVSMIWRNSFFNQEVTIRKTAPIEGFNLAGKWLGKYRNITTKEPWYILTSLADLQAAVDAYAKRFGIEEAVRARRVSRRKKRNKTMFRDFKGGGYNLEKTNLTGDRLSKLLILLSLAYLKSIIQGIDIKSKQVQEYLGRKTENHRKYARHSTFYIGLWGESWVDSMSNNWHVVVELMALSPHKLPNYQQGLRAMRLILSVL